MSLSILRQEVKKREKGKRIKEDRGEHSIAQQLKKKTEYDEERGQEDEEDAQLWERETMQVETKPLSAAYRKPSADCWGGSQEGESRPHP